MGNPNSKGEIIIKCTLEEMVKHFFKDYVIVWHDPNVNTQENQQYIANLTKFCEVFPFTEWEKAKDYIQATQAVCHVITSGTNGELLVKEIFERENVCNIYIFCGNKEHHSSWAQNYPKISCIETNIKNLINQIQQNLLEWYKKASSLNFNLPAFAPIFDDSDKSQMNHLHRYLKVIPNFKNRQQAKNDFLNLSKAIYTDVQNIKYMADFERYYNDYNKSQTLRWYTQESFLYKVTNNCLRIATSDSIQYCRLLLKDIESAIKDHYQTKSKNFNGLLYRGAYLSEMEWLSLKENQDKEIEMHGFLSVSKEKNVALNFMRTDPSKKALITIIVPKGPNEEEQGFAEIEEFSRFPQEKEVLFNVRSRFTVLETEDQYSQDLPCRHLVLLYGAQGFRKFITEQNPVRDVSIAGEEQIVGMSQKLLFLSIKTGLYYGQKYLDHDAAPFLCIPTMDKMVKSSTVKIHGCLLMNSNHNQTPFYGYKCFNCQAKRQNSFFICTDCSGKKWCEDCFNKTSTCIEVGHNILLETSPFSFWCERMSADELNHLKFQNDLVQEGDEVFQQANMYFESHKYEKAIEYYSLYVQENEAKGKDVNLATSYNNMGIVYYNQGKHQKALECHLKSLHIRKSVYGETHPSVASSYNNIGLGYYNQGEYNKALDYYLKSTNIYNSVCAGGNHPDVALPYNNLGNLYDNQGEYTKAHEYYLKSLNVRKSVYGENHPDIATSYSNIGNIYNIQGEYNKALEYYLRSLDINKAVYGDNHPEIASSCNNIGALYSKQGEHRKALEYHLKSLDTFKSVYGDNHPHIATSCNNIGLGYYNQGECDKALEYFLTSLEISKSVYGDDHTLVASSFNNLGNLYCKQGEYTKALEYYLKCLDTKKSVYGDNHPDVVMSYHNIGLVYFNLGQDNKALEYYLKSLEIKKLVYGNDHPLVASSYDNIGVVYYKQGEYNKALECYLKSLDIKKSVYGDSHPHIATSSHNIGLVYENQREYKKALEYYLKCLDIYKSIYGDQHPNTIRTQNIILEITSIGQNKQL